MMRSEILANLRADAVLMALLTGGIYDDPISRTTTPLAFDVATREILPCGYIGISSDTAAPASPSGMRAGMQIIAIYLYQRGGHATIDAAAARIRIRLHLQTIRPSSGGAWPIRWTNDIPDRDDPGLDARLTITRYRADYTAPAG